MNYPLGQPPAPDHFDRQNGPDSALIPSTETPKNIGQSENPVNQEGSIPVSEQTTPSSETLANTVPPVPEMVQAVENASSSTSNEGEATPAINIKGIEDEVERNDTASLTEANRLNALLANTPEI